MTSTNTLRLPVPEKPYPDWSRFLSAVWLHGISVKHIDPLAVSEHVDRASESIKEAMTRRNEANTIRPSAFLACARQTYFAATGATSGGMPDNIGPTFAIGHLLHELSYAAVRSALPKGFKAEIEKEVTLPDWWPDDYTRFNQSGHVDMLLTVSDTAAHEAYLDTEQPDTMLIDFKTMGGYSYRKHGKTIFGEDPDAFGYLAQLAVYSDALGTTEGGAIIAGINRDSLTQPLFPRHIGAQALKDELARVKVAIDMALENEDPGEEFLIRHDKEAYFQCGRGGKRGFCAFRDICKANPTREF